MLEVEDGRQIYYEHHRGSSRHAPVVLIHGWGASSRCWDTVLAALLRRDIEVVTFDQRCCGRSDKDFSDVSLEVQARDVVELVATTGLHLPVLNGWSFGGALAAEAAGLRGEELGGLVLTCASTPRHARGEGWDRGLSVAEIDAVGAAIGADRPAVSMAAVEAFFHAEVPRETIDWIWQMYMQNGPAADRALASLARVDHTALLPRITAHALVIGGRHDQVVPLAAAEIAAALLPDV
jgi:pimeloyl-[acyl-carrier protein] methyl ester esterase